MDLIINESFPHLSEQIFGLLSPGDFLKCLSVCKSWKALIEDNVKLWHTIGQKVIHKYDPFAYEEHWEIFEKVYQCQRDKKVVQKITKILVWYDVTFVVEDGFYATPLLHCSAKSPENLDFILSISENKNPSIGGDISILHEAAKLGQLESVKVITKYLENKNPDVDGHGITPFDYALHGEEDLNSTSCLEYLIPFASATEILHGIEDAARLGYLETLKIIISHMEERGSRLTDGVLFVPLLACLRQDHLECFKLLIPKFSNVKALVFMCISMEMDGSLLKKIEMDSIINEGCPHISELIFGLLPPEDFLKCLSVSKSWKKMIEENVKLWQTIGWKVINLHSKYYYERYKGDWEIFKKALRSKDKEVVQKMTRILVWFHERNYAGFCTNRPSPLQSCTRDAVGFPDRLDFILSISGDKIAFEYGYSTMLWEAIRCDELESVKVIAKYKDKLYNKGIGDFDNGFMIAATENNMACLQYLLPHASEKTIKETLKNSAIDGFLEIVKFLALELERRNLLNDTTLEDPLIGCISAGQLECFDFLIAKCQDVQKIVKYCVQKPARIEGKKGWLLQVLNYAYNRKFYTKAELCEFTGERPEREMTEEEKEYEEMLWEEYANENPEFD